MTAKTTVHSSVTSRTASGATLQRNVQPCRSAGRLRRLLPMTISR